MSRTGAFTELVAAGGAGEGGKGQAVLGADEYVLQLDSGDSCTRLDTLKPTEPCAFM